jgi:hypothetical protein
MSIPYDDLDAPIRPLVRFLNEELGVVTIGSCGGHKNPDEGQAPEGSWWVLVRVPEDADEWKAFEFLAWVTYRNCGRARVAYLEADAAPPYLNSWLTGDSTLRFVLSGDMPPGELIDSVHEVWDVIEAGPRGEEHGTV